MIKRPKPDRPKGKRVKPKKTDKEYRLFVKYKKYVSKDCDYIPPEIVKEFLKEIATLRPESKIKSEPQS